MEKGIFHIIIYILYNILASREAQQIQEMYVLEHAQIEPAAIISTSTKQLQLA